MTTSSELCTFIWSTSPWFTITGGGLPNRVLLSAGSEEQKREREDGRPGVVDADDPAFLQPVRVRVRIRDVPIMRHDGRLDGPGRGGREEGERHPAGRGRHVARGEGRWRVRGFGAGQGRRVFRAPAGYFERGSVGSKCGQIRLGWRVKDEEEKEKKVVGRQARQAGRWQTGEYLWADSVARRKLSVEQRKDKIGADPGCEFKLRRRGENSDRGMLWLERADRPAE